MPVSARRQSIEGNAVQAAPATRGQAGGSAAPGVSFEEGMNQNAPSAAGNQRSLQLKKRERIKRAPHAERELKLAGDEKGDQGKEGKADSDSELAAEQAQEGKGKQGKADSKSAKVKKAMELAHVVGAGAATFNSLAKTSEEWTEALEADKAGASGLGASLDAASKEASAWSDFAGGVVSIGSLIAAVLKGKDKYRKHEEFRKTKRDMKGKEGDKAQTLYEVASFAAKKAGRAFVNASIKIAEAVLDLVATIVSLAGAAAVGVVLKTISLVGKGLETIYKFADGAWEKWQKFKGKSTKRSENTDVLLKLAAGGDKEAAQLLLNLNLTFVVGGKIHDAKRKVSGSQVGGILVGEAESVSDAADMQFNSDSKPEHLCKALKDLQADAKTNKAAKASLDSLHKELESAMSSLV